MKKTKPEPVEQSLCNMNQYNIERHILRHWNIPDENMDKIQRIIPSMSFLDEKINQKIAEQNIQPPNQTGRDSFEKEFCLVYKMSMIMGGLLHPLQKELKKDYKKLIKDIKPLMENVQETLKNIDKHNLVYINQMIDNISENNPYTLLTMLDHVSSQLITVFEHPDIQQHSYWESYKGGGGIVKNRHSAISAMAESYYKCFGVEPTQSESSCFMLYAAAFYELIGMYDKKKDGSINIKEFSLEKDVKKALKKLSTISRG